MAVTILTGSIGSGKTRYCIDRIRKTHNDNPDAKCLMLVPSHYSHETERMLISEFGGTGLNNIECTSFEKLSRELLTSSVSKLGAPGKQVLVYRAVKMCEKELLERREEFDARLINAVGKQGFVDIASSLISELQRYNLSIEQLKEQTETAQTEYLKKKLEVLTIIFKNYTDLLSNTDYRDAENDLLLLADVIPDRFGKEHHIWIDKFDELLPQQLEVVKALIKSGAEITITFNTCPDFQDTYYGTKTAIEALCDFTAPKKIHLEGGMEHIKDAPDLKFLFTTWFDKDIYTEKVENCEVFTALNAYTEIEHVACKILDLVREENYRFHDIGIICADTQKYSHIIEALFDEYEIPYYSDERIAISEYPTAMQILSLFDIIENNWDYSSMLRYLRSGFVYTKVGNKYKRFDPDDIDLVENHILKYGIRYKSGWCRSWLDNNHGIIDTAFEKEPQEKIKNSEKLEKLRQDIIAPIVSYTENIKTAKTVADFCRALYSFLEDINLYQGLKTELLAMAMTDATADAQRFGQIWNLILDLLDQLNTAVGPMEITHKEFSECVKTAMGACQIRTVPSGIDRVFIGNSDMNRAIPTKVVFAVGAVSGTFPSTAAAEGFLSNAERQMLASQNFRLAPTTLKKAEKQHNTVYKLLCAATQKLYLSYPSMTPDGSANMPSQTVIDIIHKLKNIRVYDDLITRNDPALYISSPKATLHKRLINPTDHPLWKHVDSWFCEHEEWRHRLFTVNTQKGNFKYRKIELNKDIADALYNGKIRYSATRLNSYAQCPFKHFMSYGLAAKDRDIYELNAADTGTYAHELIHKFCERVDNDDSVNWSTLTDDECNRIVNDLVTDTVDKVNSSELVEKELTADILKRMGNTVCEAAKTAAKSIQCGEFKPIEYEKEIFMSLNDNVEVGGIIDRLDMCPHDGVNEYRIIDYKTGNKDFSVPDIFNGLDMQPVIYALVLRSLDKDATISGMYYSLVHNDFAGLDVGSRDSTIISNLAKNTAYNGITFVGTSEDKPIPQDELDRIESELSRNSGALFLKSKTDTVTYNSKIKTRPQGELLMDMVKNKVIDTDKKIRNGEISVSPLCHGTSSPCSYCEYFSACRFDEELRRDRQVTQSDKEVWDILEEDK